MLIVKTKHIFAPIDDIEDGNRISIGRRWVGRRREKPNSIKTLHIKHNISDLGPSVELLDDYLKYKNTTEEEYIKRFNDYVRKNKAKIQKILDELTQEAISDNNKPITLLCKCEEGYFCHRYLVKAMLLEGVDNYLARTEYDSLWRGLKRQSVSQQAAEEERPWKTRRRRRREKSKS